MAEAAAFLRLETVGKRFGELGVVRDISLAVARQEIFALLGSSGCGKSTLLRMVAGLEVPTSGRILLDGEDLATVPPHRRPTNMMFQSYALFPHMTVRGNVAFGLHQLRPRMTSAAIAERVNQMLELVQLHPLQDRKPQELSGGQQQRVALARSLAREPKLLLLDEPLSALDKRIRQRMQLELVTLIRRVGVTCVLVTHDQEEAMMIADRIGVMSPQGELLQVGAPSELYERPNCRYVAEFIGETNLLSGRIEDGKLCCDDMPAPITLPTVPNVGVAREGQPAWLSLRPERLRLLRSRPDDANRVQGQVGDVAYLGSHTLVHLAVAGGRQLIASRPSTHDDKPPARGDAMWLAWSADDGVVLTR